MAASEGVALPPGRPLPPLPAAPMQAAPMPNGPRHRPRPGSSHPGPRRNSSPLDPLCHLLLLVLPPQAEASPLPPPAAVPRGFQHRQRRRPTRLPATTSRVRTMMSKLSSPQVLHFHTHTVPQGTLSPQLSGSVGASPVGIPEAGCIPGRRQTPLCCCCGWIGAWRRRPQGRRYVADDRKGGV